MVHFFVCGICFFCLTWQVVIFIPEMNRRNTGAKCLPRFHQLIQENECAFMLIKLCVQF